MSTILDELRELGVHELIRRIIELESENDALKRAVARAMCGDAMGPTTTCQLARGHDGLHAWSAHDSVTIIRWG